MSHSESSAEFPSDLGCDRAIPAASTERQQTELTPEQLTARLPRLVGI